MCLRKSIGNSNQINTMRSTIVFFSVDYIKNIKYWYKSTSVISRKQFFYWLSSSKLLTFYSVIDSFSSKVFPRFSACSSPICKLHASSFKNKVLVYTKYINDHFWRLYMRGGGGGGYFKPSRGPTKLAKILLIRNSHFLVETTFVNMQSLRNHNLRAFRKTFFVGKTVTSIITLY